MSFSSFLADLRRRHVFRVAGIYAGAAFVVLQVADIFVPALHLPDATMTVLAVLVILGFPVALALAWAFDITPGGVEQEGTDTQPQTGHSSTARWALVGVMVLAVAASGWLGWRRWGGAPTVGLDSEVVAVLPFRVAGADPSLGYLREGMLDLLAAKLTGEGGARAVDPRTLMSAWRQTVDEAGADLSRTEALGLARGLGAGRLVLGEVVSLPGRVVLTASLSNVGSGRTDAPVSVEGPVDSLPALVDRLVVGLLSVGAGEGERLASLTTTSLPALRLYLEGQADYRSGRYDAALTRFSRAIEIDSTFALAALMTHRSALWLSPSGNTGNPAALALAWRHRERLGAPDRAYLTAIAGPRYPAHTPGAEWFATFEALVRNQPDNPEAWFNWGDGLLHWGPLLGIPDSTALRRAAGAFDRTLALDSMYLPALGHLFDIAAIRGDTAAARRYSELYLARDPVGLIADAIRNARAVQTRGMSAMPEIIARVDSVGGVLRRYTLLELSFHPETMPTALALADHLGSRIGDPEILREVGTALVTMTLNRGRPTEAVRYLRTLHRGGAIDSVEHLVAQVRNGLYEDGDPEAAARAALSLARHLEQSTNDSSDFQALCVLGQWHLARGKTAAASPLIERLHAFGNTDDSVKGGMSRLCVAALDTWRDVELGAPDAPARLARLDSLSTANFFEGRFTYETNLILARLLEVRGDRAGALRVLGRYPVYAGAYSSYRSTYLRERGRVAALLGDTAAAIEAYRYYLAMRTDPEPRLRPEVERVRAELIRLTGGRPR